MPSPKRKLGDIGENYAAKYLTEHQYRIIERNYWKPFGEIDIVAEKDGITILCEVKTGLLTSLILPEENLTRDKMKKLKNIISHYIASHNIRTLDCRIDVLAVYLNKDANFTLHKINHIENIALN